MMVADTVRDILSKLAVVVPGKGWKLKIDPDNDFLDARPEYSGKFEQYWKDNSKAYYRTFLPSF